MKQVIRATLGGLSLIVAVAACADPADRISGPATGLLELRAADAEGTGVAERAALARIGRLVALSLGDKAMRHQLKKHLRAAPFKEHKLKLSAYLRSADGTQLLGRIAAGESKSDAILTILDQVRPLELYMPVQKHRETWSGDEELLVAVQLEEEDSIVGFNRRGEQVPLDPVTPPDQPTISIVPVETRFDRPLPLGSKNINDLNGKAIGTLMPASFRTSALVCADCAPDDGGGGGVVGGGGGSVPPGLYLEFSRILNVHEPWTKGQPEIEVHIHGPTDQGNPKLGQDLSCAGAQAYDYRKVFDQNDGFWEGRVMLFSDAEAAAYVSKFAEGFHVLFWEDDDTACVIKLDNDSLLELIRSSAKAFGTVAIKVVAPNAPWYVVAGAFLAALFENAGAWLKTNDDFVGAAVPQGSAGYNYPENTHVIMEGTKLNGRATIVYR